MAGKKNNKKRKKSNQDISSNSMSETSLNMAANGNSNTQGNIDNFVVKGGVSKTGSFESDTMLAILKSIETMQKNQDEHFTAQTKMLNDVLIDQKQTMDDLKKV